ncbi:HNH endonuclease signature motif containing protein [Chelatococcus reniformis]|uniref:HNH endonuclease signature motif containing protein n=1 Tax=Chelatococcus reniformis TaxID=1494448 RepID=UPI001664C480|nr:HNH endonuclease signature motif containing protein [Chelatococcus reniformis]
MSRRLAIRAKILAGVVGVDGCWIWAGPTSGDSGRGAGYPRMSLDGGTMAVHKVHWICEYGPIPPRKQLDHRCRNRLCVRLDHLELVTHRQNQLRRDRARRQIVCTSEGMSA